MSEENKTIMESDTKKKRGRPKLPLTIAVEAVFPEKETRAAQNMIYAMQAVMETGNRDNPFFNNGRGGIRRQGIAEQIGRMLEAEMITTDQAKELIQESIDKYKDGQSVKEIERYLKDLRLLIEAAIKQEGRQ